jgi:hypothetical protein
MESQFKKPSLQRSALAKAEIGRNDWAAPEPVTGHHQ